MHPFLLFFSIPLSRCRFEAFVVVIVACSFLLFPSMAVAATTFVYGTDPELTGTEFKDSKTAGMFFVNGEENAYRHIIMPLVTTE